MARPGSRNAPFDAIVVGGGHNGLVAACYLAAAGARVSVLERREVVGGAAVTEQPWGPDFKVSTLSYVMGLMPASIVAELELPRFGYRVHRQGPYFSPLADGRYLALPDDPRRRREQIAKFSKRDADAVVEYDAWLRDLAATLGPLLARTPPRLGSPAPRDVADQAALAWGLRGLGVRGVADLTRLLTASAADLLDRWFESPQLRGVLAVSSVIGAWAGPRTPGTAYVLAHHQIGDAVGRTPSTWGFPAGGMGAVSDALRRSAAARGVTIRTSTPVARIDVQGGRVRGVVTEDGDEHRAEVVVAATHPQLTFLRHLDPGVLPDEFVRDVRSWRSRSGTVKVNLAVDRLPEFASKPGFDPDVHGGTIVLAPSLDALEVGFQEAAAGRPSSHPFADVCIPSVFDRTLCPEGTHVVSMFTQWVPHQWSRAPLPGELDTFADRVVDAMDAVAPGFGKTILHRQVLGPYEMEAGYGLVGGNIFHGELAPDQLFHLRPAPGFADNRTPVAGLYQCGSATHGGGGVNGIPGRNAARRILRDRRRARPRVLA